MPNYWNTYFLFSCLQNAKRQLPEYVYEGAPVSPAGSRPSQRENKKLVGYTQRYFLIWGKSLRNSRGGLILALLNGRVVLYSP